MVDSGADTVIHSYERGESRPLVANRLSFGKLPTTPCHVCHKLLVFREESASSKVGKLGYLLPILLTKHLDFTLTWNAL
jgi:hypothetical protein